MTMDALYDDIRNSLRVTGWIIAAEGKKINPGEKFTIRFAGSNTCPPEWIDWHRQPDVIFRNPRIKVKGTTHAEPVGGDAWHNLPDKRLYPGESSTVDIEFVAKATYDGDSPELVARAWITADLDLSKFFKVWNSRDLRWQIYESQD